MIVGEVSHVAGNSIVWGGAGMTVIRATACRTFAVALAGTLSLPGGVVGRQAPAASPSKPDEPVIRVVPIDKGGAPVPVDVVDPRGVQHKLAREAELRAATQAAGSRCTRNEPRRNNVDCAACHEKTNVLGADFGGGKHAFPWLILALIVSALLAVVARRVYARRRAAASGLNAG